MNAEIDVVPAPETAEQPVVLCSLGSPGAFVVDGQTIRIRGWVVASEPVVSLQAAIDGTTLGSVQFGLNRPDVAASHPEFPQAVTSGFACEASSFPQRDGGSLTITISITLASGYLHSFVHRTRVLSAAGDIIAACRAAGDLSPQTLTDAARLLAASKRFDDAEILAAVAAMRFPDDIAAACEFASIVTQPAAADMGEETLRRWQAVQQRFPDSAAPLIGEAKALIALRRIDEADLRLSAVARRWPNIPEVEALNAHLPVHRAFHYPIDRRRQFYVEAQSRWAVFRDRHPNHPVGYLLGADVHNFCNEFAVGEALVMEAMDRFPDHTDAMVRYAAIATMRGDPAEALRRWKIARQRFPDMPSVMAWEQRARNEMLMESPPIEDDRQVDDASGPSDQTLMMMFESLGFNCEFGVVQRHFDAEPLGLLRFASLTLEQLIRALDARFEGVGDPDNTTFELRQYPQVEYWLSDKRFGLLMHTFLYPENLLTEEQRRQAFEKHCRRIGYLAAKLVQDLESAEKILVFQINRRISQAELQALYSAVCRYGPNSLLCVDPADKEHEAGLVTIVEPGLMRGHLNSFCYADVGSKFDIDNWQKICRRAFTIWQAAKRPPIKEREEPAGVH